MTPSLRICTVSAAALIIVACSSKQPDDASSAPRIEGVKRTNEHWVQGQQLRELMASVAEKTQQLPKGLPDDVEAPPATAKTFTEAAAAADQLIAAADRIPSAVAAVKMNEADRKAFTSLAQTLADQAAQFKKSAQARDVERMQNNLSAITSTCSTCHLRYRDFSGDLNWLKRA